MDIKKIAMEIESLDTFPESGVVSYFVDKVLRLEPVTIFESKIIFDCLWELFVKLSENYDCFNQTQSTQIIKLADKNWSDDDVDYLECLLSVVLNCDSNLALNLLWSKVNDAKTDISKNMIKEGIVELCDDIKETSDT